MKDWFSHRAVWLFIGFLSLVTTSSFAAPPNLVQYTGLMTDNEGNPLPDGAYSVVFKLYTVASGGAEIWSEAWDQSDAQHQKVATQNGRFTVLLGNNTDGGLPSQIFVDNDEIYLGVTIQDDDEMLPRQRISSVPYALVAGGGIPAGGIIMWSGAVNSVPDGWALCDGTNGTPDLRNRFVVGAGGSYSVNAKGGSTTKNLRHSHTGPSHRHTGPSHSHSIGHLHYVSRVNDGSSWSENGGGLEHGGDYAGQTMNGSQSPTTSGSNGTGNTGASGTGNTGQAGSASQNILPPYYALAYIMKL